MHASLHQSCMQLPGKENLARGLHMGLSTNHSPANTSPLAVQSKLPPWPGEAAWQQDLPRYNWWVIEEP